MKHDSFWHWLFRRFRFIPAILPFTPLVEYARRNFASLATPDEALVKIGFLIQDIIILAYAGWLFFYMFFEFARRKRLPLKKDANPVERKEILVAQEAADQFCYWFVGLLASWAGLYFYLWHYAEPHAKNDSVGNLLNNLCSCFILVCYYTLSYYTVPEQTPGSEPEAQIRIELKILGTVLVLLLVGFFGLQVLLDSNNVDAASKFVTFVSGAVGGVVTALFAERLGGRSAQAPFALIILLYMYSAIQFAWAFFMTNVSMTDPEVLWFRLVLPVAALLGKSILFLLIFWMIETHRLEYQMWRSRRVLADVERDRLAFKELFA